jgi:signal transduction histidine kinase
MILENFLNQNKEKKTTTYNELLNSVLSLVETPIKNHNIELIENLQCSESFDTYTNEVKQVILNIIKNAEDILLDKNIQNRYIKIKTYCDSDKAILEISDNGGGINEEYISKIFDPYFSTKTKKDGTGLGLYMSKTIIEDHCGGKLSVSNSQDGAVFKIILYK